MTERFASHVLMVAPFHYRSNAETAESNVFQHDVGAAQAAQLAELAQTQHAEFRNRLIDHGVTVTCVRSLDSTPDAPFCNNWFSTHPPTDLGREGTLVLYPMLAPSRRLERRPEVISLLRQRYPRTVDLSVHEQQHLYLESTGSLSLDSRNGVAYAAISPRTDLGLARIWAAELGYRLVAFQSTDGTGTPYYHTNVMMFLGHGLTGICLESIAEHATDGLASRETVAASLRDGGFEILPITRDQVLAYCGNALALVSESGEPLFAMSSTAYRGFSETERQRIEKRGTIVHAELSAFETLGGGSARCLLGEIY
ncbi:MAG: arginine deiminase-related protein [Gemmatimonadales bacterium]